MAFTKITNADLNNKGVIGLPDTPQLSTMAMQEKFEETARDVIIPKFNNLVDDLSMNTAAASIGVQGAVKTNLQSKLDSTDRTLSTHATDISSLKTSTSKLTTDMTTVTQQSEAATQKVNTLETSVNSMVSDVSDLKTKSHTHTNKTVLDEFGENELGNPTYKGQPIGGGGGDVEVDNVTIKYNIQEKLSVPIDNDTIKVEGGVLKAKQQTDQDTKNTAGSSNKTGTKMFIVGATSQNANGVVTNSNSNCYVGTDNCLYSNGNKVSTTDTKNTAGATALTGTKLFLVGSQTTTAEATTNTNMGCYIGEDGALYSQGSKVALDGTTARTLRIKDLITGSQETFDLSNYEGKEIYFITTNTGDGTITGSYVIPVYGNAFKNITVLFAGGTVVNRAIMGMITNGIYKNYLWNTNNAAYVETMKTYIYIRE